MQTTDTLRLRSLEFDNAATYIAASLFILGNIMLP